MRRQAVYWSWIRHPEGGVKSPFLSRAIVTARISAVTAFQSPSIPAIHMSIRRPAMPHGESL